MLYPETRNERTDDVQNAASTLADELDALNLHGQPGDVPVENFVIIAIDRSSSMTNEPIDAVENAAATLALALEELEYNVCVADVYDCDARIISPFTDSLTTTLNDVLTGEVKGSTPFTKLVTKVREESTYHQGNDNESITSLIAVTDGLPDNADAFTREVSDWGINTTAVVPMIDTSNNPASSYMLDNLSELYDAYTIARSENDLSFLLKQAFINDMLFQ